MEIATVNLKNAVNLIALSTFNFDTLITELNSVLSKYENCFTKTKQLYRYIFANGGCFTIYNISELNENELFFPSHSKLFFEEHTNQYNNYYFTKEDNIALINSIDREKYKVLLTWQVHPNSININEANNFMVELLPFFQVVNTLKSNYSIQDNSILPKIVVENAINDYFDDMDDIIENFEVFENFEDCRYKYLQNIIREIFNRKFYDINELHNNKHISEDEYIYLRNKNNSRIEPNIKYYSGKTIDFATILDILNSILLPIFNKQKNNSFNYPETDDSRETESDYKNMDSIEKYY
jgi:hypothetical protein